MRHLAPNDSRTTDRIQGAGLSSLAAGRSPEIESRLEAVLVTVLESADCGIVLFGSGGDLWAVNDRFAGIVGVEPERLRELRNLEQVVAKVAPQFAHADSEAVRWRQRFRNGEASRDELELAKPEKKILERHTRAVLNR